MGRQNKLSLDFVSRHSDTWRHNDTAPQCVTSLLRKCTVYVAWHRDVPSSKDTGCPSGQVTKVDNQASPAAWWVWCIYNRNWNMSSDSNVFKSRWIFGIVWSIWTSIKFPPPIACGSICNAVWNYYVLHPQWMNVRNRWLPSEKWCLSTAWMTPKSSAPDRSLHQHLPVSGSQCISAANKSASPIPGWLMDVHFLNVKWFLTSRLVPLILVKVSR